jgi:hypothetical protein
VRNRSARRATYRQAPLQLRMALENHVLKQLSIAERSRAVAQLANLLLLAAGVAVKERSDDDRC